MMTKAALAGVRSFLVMTTILLLGTLVKIYPSGSQEITREQSIARVRSILTSNGRNCRITKIRSISAKRTAFGWRVTASVAMSASGRSRSETPSWLVSSARGTTAQDPLAADIGGGCR